MARPEIQRSAPPILLRHVIENVADVVGLLERNAPYTPLGGWYRPGADLDAATSPMWFQNDWCTRIFASRDPSSSSSTSE